MSSSQQTHPVERGKTYYGRSQTIDTDNYERTDMEGYVAQFKHTDPSDPTKVLSNRLVTAVLMRNTSGITVYKGMAVTGAAGYIGKRFDGYSAVANAKIVGVIDDHLNSAGCRNGDMCWVLVDGPIQAYFAGGAVLAEGSILVSTTAANSTGNTTGGTTANNAGKFSVHPGTFNVTADVTGGVIFKVANYRWGFGVSAATTNNTNTLKNIDIKLIS